MVVDKRNLSNVVYFLFCFLGHVRSEMKIVFKIAEDTETRLWVKYMTNRSELLANMEQPVLEAGLYHGQVHIEVN